MREIEIICVRIRNRNGGSIRHHISIGGVQRVFSLLIPELTAPGYQVALITDTGPAAQDYPHCLPL